MALSLSGLKINGYDISTEHSCAAGGNSYAMTGDFTDQNGNQYVIQPGNICFNFQYAGLVYASTVDAANSGKTSLAGTFDYPKPSSLFARLRCWLHWLRPKLSSLSTTVTIPGPPPVASNPYPVPPGTLYVPQSP